MATNSLNAEAYKPVEGQKFTFFWRSESPFSQWHKSTFYVDGIKYNCAEQYMMHQKAVLFGDEGIAQKILKSDSPRQQKSLGRKVKGFVEDTWNSKCFDIVKDGNRAKFSQKKELKEILFATSGTELVEASPMDTIWGIGLAEDDPRAHNKDTWMGKNLLGYALTEIREEMMKEEANQT